MIQSPRCVLIQGDWAMHSSWSLRAVSFPVTFRSWGGTEDTMGSNRFKRLEFLTRTLAQQAQIGAFPQVCTIRWRYQDHSGRERGHVSPRTRYAVVSELWIYIPAAFFVEIVLISCLVSWVKTCFPITSLSSVSSFPQISLLSRTFYPQQWCRR